MALLPSTLIYKLLLTVASMALVGEAGDHKNNNEMIYLSCLLES